MASAFIDARLAGLFKNGSIEMAMARGRRKIPILTAKAVMQQFKGKTLDEVVALFQEASKKKLLCGRLSLQVEKSADNALLFGTWR